MARLTGVLGILAILLFAYLFSTDRKAIRYRTVFVGLILQFVFAILVLRVSFGVRVMTIAGDAVNRLLSYSFAGSQSSLTSLGPNSPASAWSSPSRCCPSSFLSPHFSPSFI